MKANEAPEKIYLDSYGSGFSHGFHTNKLYDSDVEYIRKDAFIEKACEWIKKNITNNPNANSVLVRNGCVTLGMLVDHFKKYMEE